MSRFVETDSVGKRRQQYAIREDTLMHSLSSLEIATMALHINWGRIKSRAQIQLFVYVNLVFFSGVTCIVKMK